MDNEPYDFIDHPLDGPKDPGGTPKDESGIMDDTPSLADIMAPWVYLNDDDPDQWRPDHDHHWHKYGTEHEDWESVYCNHRDLIGDWLVEHYDPSQEPAIDRRSFDNPEAAAEFVADVMEDDD